MSALPIDGAVCDNAREMWRLGWFAAIACAAACDIPERPDPEPPRTKGAVDAGSEGGDAAEEMGPPAEGALSLYLTAKTSTPGTTCSAGSHWINVPFAASGRPETTTTEKGATAIDARDGMSVACSVTSDGTKFRVSASLRSPALDPSTSAPVNPTVVSLTTAIAPDEAGAPGTVSILDDRIASPYVDDACSFSVHRTESTDELAVDSGRIWASVTCLDLRDPGSPDPNEVCEIATGVFVLENCR